MSGQIQLDDVYWDGEHRGGKRGRGAPVKTPCVAAVALSDAGHPLRLRMSALSAFRSPVTKR